MTNNPAIRSVRNWTFAALFAMFAGGTLLATVPQAASAADPCNSGFLGFPAWYRGLTDTNCAIVQPGSGEDDLSNFIWHIVLNVIEIALWAVGYIATIFILYGGFIFLTSAGDPSNAAKGRTTILNAVIGLAISIGSIAIVNTIVTIINQGSVATINGSNVSIPAQPADQVLGSVLNIFYFTAGITAVISIIIAGFSMVVNGSDPGAVVKARNAILYSVIGLVVIALAFVITQFVTGRF